MSEVVHHDPYSEIAVLSLYDFELRGNGIAVPLFFKPDAAFITRTVLEQEAEFTREAIVEKPGFREVCESTYPLHRFMGVFSDLRFTFDSLGSTLIQTAYKRGRSNIYMRNPSYKIEDGLKLLSRIK
jgi:hypothetical protein